MCPSPPSRQVSNRNTVQLAVTSHDGTHNVQEMCDPRLDRQYITGLTLVVSDRQKCIYIHSIKPYFLHILRFVGAYLRIYLKISNVPPMGFTLNAFSANETCLSQFDIAVF